MTAITRTTRPSFQAWPEWEDEISHVRSTDAPFSFEQVVIETLSPEEVTRSPRPLPEQLIERYVKAALERACVEVLEDGSGLYAHVPVIQGAWGDGLSEGEALEDLASAIRDWVIFKMQRRHKDIPELAGIDLNRG